MLVSSISNVNYAYLKKSKNNATPIASSFKNDVPTDNKISFGFKFDLFKKPVFTTGTAIQKLAKKTKGMYVKPDGVSEFCTAKNYEEFPKQAIAELIIKQPESSTNGFSPTIVDHFLGKNFKKLNKVVIIIGDGYQELSLPANLELKRKALIFFSNHENMKKETQLLQLGKMQKTPDCGFYLANKMINDANIEGLTLKKLPINKNS